MHSSTVTWLTLICNLLFGSDKHCGALQPPLRNTFVLSSVPSRKPLEPSGLTICQCPMLLWDAKARVSLGTYLLQVWLPYPLLCWDCLDSNMWNEGLFCNRSSINFLFIWTEFIEQELPTVQEVVLWDAHSAISDTSPGRNNGNIREKCIRMYCVANLPFIIQPPFLCLYSWLLLFSFDRESSVFKLAPF